MNAVITEIFMKRSKRSGILYTGINDDRIKVAGKAVLYSEGVILEK